ncbi:MAG TPA: pyrroline-5-carboxylate reductase [Nitrospiraceae bacterium]|nr:pyrroline-5-carboxylate reductase [Nitrospiraceae bacterium]
MKNKGKICIIGAGNMGEALLKGMLQAGIYTKAEIIVTDISPERLEYIKSTYDVDTTKDNTKAATLSDVIIISVKPDNMKSLIEEISHSLDKSKVIISVVTGISINRMHLWLSKKVPVIRVMSNTPMIVMEGATAIAPGPGVKGKDLETTKKIFNSVGKTIILDEKHLDAVTGLSGSGPAYIFTIIEALTDGGVRVGLPRKAALLLASQTVLGAAKMVLDTGKHIGSLKDMVTSPGGTTIEGLYRLEKSGIRAALISAVEHATRKATELGKGD